MCEALKELMKDEFDAVRRDALEKGLEQGLEQGIQSMILALLEDFGEIPEELRVQIMEEKNLDTLKLYHKMAARAESMEQFKKEIQACK